MTIKEAAKMLNVRPAQIKRMLTANILTGPDKEHVYEKDVAHYRLQVTEQRLGKMRETLGLPKGE